MTIMTTYMQSSSYRLIRESFFIKSARRTRHWMSHWCDISNHARQIYLLNNRVNSVKPFNT